jgi:hypothetical protein
MTTLKSSPIKIPELTFLVPGFSKCGTTTLCNLLSQHPEIFIPIQKEPMFFNNRNYHKHWDLYSNHFSSAHPGQKLGEGTTFYSTKNNEEFVRKQLKLHYPEIKLIFIARDPIARIESSFREFHHSGPRFGVLPAFTIKGALKQLPAIVNDTMYWSRLNAYRSYLPHENIHVVFLEDLEKDAQNELKKCFKFLSVKPINITGINKQKLNTGDSKLFDSRLFRTLRASPLIGPWLAQFPIEQQDYYARKLGFRRPFTKNLEWDKDSVESLIYQLHDEVEMFLSDNNKPANFWPKWHKFKQS